MSKTLYQTIKGAKQANAEEGRWLFGVNGIVADNNDSERQHRVKVIIPSIDEDLVYDEWVRQMVFCLGNGFGSAFIPPIGTEVVLFGELGEKFNLFYATVYNEEMFVPEGFDNEMTVGIHAPGNLTFIAEQLAKILAQNIEINAQQLAKLLGQNVEVHAEQLSKVSGDNVTVQADQLSELKGNKVNATADGEFKLQGATVKINADGSLSIHGASVSITGDVVTIQNRMVNKVGPPI